MNTENQTSGTSKEDVARKFYGVFSKYANKKLRKKEKEAWVEAAIEKENEKVKQILEEMKKET